jgi:hypothetical protein
MMLPNPDMSVSLNDLEIELANELAFKRFDSCSNENVINRKVASRKTNQEIEEMGTRSEIAFCKLMNCYPDLSYHPRKGSADCVINGVAIDIKTTKLQEGKLLVTPKKKYDGGIDMFVLMTGLDRKFTYRGWMDSASVYERELSDLGYGPTYVINQKELKQYEYRR